MVARTQAEHEAINAVEYPGTRQLGDVVECPQCGQKHTVEYGEEVLKDGTKKPSKLLAFYSCGDKSYLAGINGFAL